MSSTTETLIPTRPTLGEPLVEEIAPLADWYEQAVQTEAPVFRPRASSWGDEDEEEEIDDDVDDDTTGAEEIEADPFDDFDEEDFDDDFDDDFEEELEDEYEIEPADDGAVEDLGMDDEDGLDDDEPI